MESIGKDTLKAMASAGQDHQVKMLQSLGLTSTLITGKIIWGPKFLAKNPQIFLDTFKLGLFIKKLFKMDEAQ